MNYFETIKCNDSQVYNIHYHEKRIAKTIGKNINLLEYIYPPSDDLLKCKVIYSQDEIINVSFDLYTKRDLKIFKLVDDDRIDYKYKYENRKNINDLYSKRNSADEIIIVKNHLITDTAIANIAVLIENQWYTPKQPLLQGTTRQRYIDDGILKEKDIDIKILKKATKIALLNAMIDFDIIDDYKILF
jgi:4-amino-4-deoxychorismate lyase